MEGVIEMGKVSSRGQIAIPQEIREKMGLEEGMKVLFFLENDTLLIKRIHQRTFADITKPLREAKKKIKEEEVVDLIHRFRKSKND